MLQSKTAIVNDMQDYKFYIAGTVTNLQRQSANGYDINENDLIGITSTLTDHN
jgi:hypothetical protein